MHFLQVIGIVQNIRRMDWVERIYTCFQSVSTIEILKGAILLDCDSSWPSLRFDHNISLGRLPYATLIVEGASVRTQGESVFSSLQGDSPPEFGLFAYLHLVGVFAQRLEPPDLRVHRLLVLPVALLRVIVA